MKSRFVGWLLILSVALSVRAVLLSGQASSPPAVPTNLRILSGPPSGATIFFDDFLGTSIDASKWNVIDRISDQENGELNCFLPANLSVGGSLLSGVARFEDHSCGDSIQAPQTEHYTSWMIQQKTPSFRYGTVEVRAKIPGGIGIWPCIWMVGFEYQTRSLATGNPPEQNWPHAGWSEIDIAEFMSNSRTTVNNQVHFESPNVGPGIKNMPYDATTRFMVYRLQWAAGSMTWSVDAEDGVGYRTLSSLSGASVPNVAMYVVLNMAVGGIGGGAPNSSTFPLTMQVDYVRIMQ
jgi:beta-glucanase (GH16 family)